MMSGGELGAVPSRDVARGAQALADAIGPRRPWVLVIDDPQAGERVYTSETIERARSMLRAAALLPSWKRA